MSLDRRIGGKRFAYPCLLYTSPEVILRDPYPELKIGSYDNCLIPELKREDGKLANPFEGVVQGNYCMKAVSYTHLSGVQDKSERYVSTSFIS